MKIDIWKRRLLLTAFGALLAVMIAPRLSAIPGAKRQDAAPSAVFSLSAQPPKGAVTLFSGKEEQIHENFYKRYTKDPSGWTVDAQGVASPTDKSDVTSKQEFGDSYIHAEFRSILDVNGKALGHGNSGVAPLGRYEVQVFDSYGKARPSAEDCGAFYSEKPPIVNACKKAGEWQTYDIIFRAPRFDASGKLTENARATVFLNGVLVQNNEEFTRMTGIQYSEYKEQVKTGPLVLQGNHDPVQFRNVWVAPL